MFLDHQIIYNHVTRKTGVMMLWSQE